MALATGMAPICSGSDTGGSLRNPAAVLRHRRLPPHARPGSERAARARLEQPARRRPHGPHRPRSMSVALHHGQHDTRDPLRPADRASPRTSPHHRASTCRAYASRSHQTSASPPPNATSPKSFAEKTAPVPPCLRPRRRHHARLRWCRRSIRGAAFARLPSQPPGQGARPPRRCRTQRARQCRGRPALHRPRRRAGAGIANRAVSPLAKRSSRTGT